MTDIVPTVMFEAGVEGEIDRARKLLAGIPHAAEKAIGSAIKRAGNSGLTYAWRRLSNDYTVSAGGFKSYTRSSKKLVSSGSDQYIQIEFRGNHIPLSKFHTSVSKNGAVSVNVKRSSAKVTFERAFFATVGSHSGVFERETEKRTPIRELFGPSAPQIMSYNDDVSQDIGEHIQEEFAKRLDHEILAVMNGWRQ